MKLKRASLARTDDNTSRDVRKSNDSTSRDVRTSSNDLIIVENSVKNVELTGNTSEISSAD